MNDLIFFYPEGHEAHAKPGHPERPERVEVILNALRDTGLWDKYPHTEPTTIPEEVLKSIHTPEYLETLKSSCESGLYLDADTYTTNRSWELSLAAVGGAIAVVRQVWLRDAERGFALTRPPGHHATRTRGMGFCLINNIAVAAEYLLQKEGAQRLAIVDIDLHHGNGTQEIFWRRGEVIYFSTHQYPHYPGTGNLQETGEGEGENTTVNIPMPIYSGDQAFASAMDTIIQPLLDRFQPEMILVSIGFDVHWCDPLGMLLVSATGYGNTIASLARWADNNCHGRIALFLEGGYDLDAGACCALASTNALLGNSWKDPLGISPTPESNLWEEIIQKAKELWNL